MKFKIKNFLLLFLLMLPFGNFPQLFNFGEDTGSLLITLVILPLFIAWLVLEKKLYVPLRQNNKILLLIIFIGIIFDLISIFAGTVNFSDGLIVLLQLSIPKLLFIYLIVVIAERISLMQAEQLMKFFTIIVVISLFASVFLYYLNPIPEFVFYDGQTRFAGFHFELVNYTYVILICFFIYSYFKKFSYINFVIVLIFLYFSARTNAFYPFVGIAILSILLTRLKMLFVTKLMLASVIILTPLIGIFLDYFSFLDIIAVRQSAEFSLEGSSLYVRLYPWALAMQHILDNPFMMPIGLGMLGISPYIIETENLFGGTGITAIIAEYGILSILIMPFIFIYFAKIVNECSKIMDKNARICVLTILMLSVTYICIQSGFFNLTAWSISIIIQTIALKYSNKKLNQNSA